MFDALLEALRDLAQVPVILALIAMVPLALFSGIMPGGTLPVTVVILGFASVLDPVVAFVLVLSHIAIAELAEAIPAILLGVPGGRGAQATVLDGYPLSRKGLAGMAIGANFTASLMGGVVGAIALFLFIPIARELLRIFSSAEFFLLAVLGVASVAIVSSGAMVKGLLTAAFGFCIALIGFSNTGGDVRVTLGIDYLFDGVPLVPVVVGLFAIPELIGLVVANQSIATDRLESLLHESQKDVLRGMGEAWHHKFLILRSSLIGVFVGIMPGLGAGPAHWIAYVQARQTEKGGTETFGTGDIRGVIASDSANNSEEGGALIPTVFFGIPGSGGMAIFLGLMVLVGYAPGPQMLKPENLHIVMVMILTVALAPALVFPVQVFMARYLAKLTLIPPNILFPIVTGILVLTTWEATSSIGDLFAMLSFSVLGLFMKRYGWPRPPILIAVVLTGVVEKYLWISVNTYGLHMLARVQFLGILVVVVTGVLLSFRVQAQARAAQRQMEARGADVPGVASTAGEED